MCPAASRRRTRRADRVTPDVPSARGSSLRRGGLLPDRQDFASVWSARRIAAPYPRHHRHHQARRPPPRQSSSGLHSDGSFSARVLTLGRGLGNAAPGLGNGECASCGTGANPTTSNACVCRVSDDQVQSPAPGDPPLARRVQVLLSPLPVTLDDSCGFDPGTWSVLRHVSPFGPRWHAPSVFWCVGGAAPEFYETPQATGRVSKLSANHNSPCAPVLHPTPETGVASFVVAFRAWLATQADQ